ncbi:hypothetical protein ACHQM5_010894 [Ranunculus cassubicifolius]
MDFYVPVLLQWIKTQQQTVLQYPLSLCLLLFSLFILLRLNRVSGCNGKAIRLPPSPPRLPIVGHLHRLGTLPHRSLKALSDKYGPLMLLYLGQQPTLIVSSAEMAKQIMKIHDIIFADRPITTVARVFLYGGKDLVFAPYGEHWRQMRKLCILDLLSVKRVQSFRFFRVEEIRNMVYKIKESSSLGKEINLSLFIINLTNNLISRIALGKSLETGVFAKLVKESMNLSGSPSAEDMFPSLRWIDVLTGFDKRMKETSKALLQFFDEVIEEHLIARKQGNGQADCRDFVDVLLDHQNDSTLGILTRENIHGVLMNMFVAGTDTIYTTVEWAMAELVNHPKTMKKLQEEVRKVVGAKSDVDEDDIKKMDYLNCVIKETLRLHPPLVLNLQRVSTTSAIIDGYTIPAKIVVMVNVWAIARDPSIWEKPNEFIPERFFNNPVDFRGQDFEFIPFGAGRRGCPGISFGVTSVESILANLLYWLNWELPGGENKKDIDTTEAFGLSVNLKHPLHLFPIFHSVSV